MTNFRGLISLAYVDGSGCCILSRYWKHQINSETCSEILSHHSCFVMIDELRGIGFGSGLYTALTVSPLSKTFLHTPTYQFLFCFVLFVTNCDLFYFPGFSIECNQPEKSIG